MNRGAGGGDVSAPNGYINGLTAACDCDCENDGWLDAVR